MRIIYISPQYKDTYITDRHHILFKEMCKRFHFEMRYEEKPKVPKGTEIVFVWTGPAWYAPERCMNLVNLNKNTKLIWNVGDIWAGEGKPLSDIPFMNYFGKKTDIIFSSLDESFKNLYPDLVDKHQYFPHYIGNVKLFDKLPFNEKPIMKCLLSGARANWFYPLRNHLLANKNDKYFDEIAYPGVLSKDGYIRDEYIKLLNRYAINVGSKTIYNFVVGKYFEIAGSGSLLLAETCNDVKKCGFEAFRHYIPIDKDCSIDAIKFCIHNYRVFRNIRIQAKKFILRHHTIENRLQLIAKIINRGYRPLDMSYRDNT